MGTDVKDLTRLAVGFFSDQNYPGQMTPGCLFFCGRLHSTEWKGFVSVPEGSCQICDVSHTAGDGLLQAGEPSVIQTGWLGPELRCARGIFCVIINMDPDLKLRWN